MPRNQREPRDNAITGSRSGALWYASWTLGGDAGTGEPVVLEVEDGATATSIGNRLVELGVVRNALAFRLKARSEGLDARIQAGAYDMETGMSVEEAIARLLEGPGDASVIRFTVIEGLTVDETLESLSDQTPYTALEYRAVLDAAELDLPEWVPDPGAVSDDVRDPYEGLLFPETYELADEATAANVLQRMVDELADVVGPVAQADSVGFDPYQRLIVASLVEAETRVADERPAVSAVIYNRLARGDMRLQIDATVLYAIGEHRDEITAADLQFESPYNTYRVDGLPPTPIAGPGAASIAAAFAPADVPHLYYVRNDCEVGTHAFAETLDEHNANVAAFRALDCGG